MNKLFVCLWIFSATIGWAQCTYTVKEVPFDGHSIELDIYFATPTEKYKTVPFPAENIGGMRAVPLDTILPPSRPEGFYFGMQLHNSKGKIVDSSSRCESVDLVPGLYSITCWSNSKGIENPPDFSFEVKQNVTEHIELVFTSEILKKEDIDESVFEQD